MSMTPGSHREPIRKHDDTFAEANILTRGQVVRDVDESSAVNLIMKPGQMSLHHAKVVHGSQPNRSAYRRIGFAIQSYMPAHARQTVGKNYWLPTQGSNNHEDGVTLHRPQFDLDPRGVAERKMANDNFAEILYEGAEKTRAY